MTGGRLTSSGAVGRREGSGGEHLHELIAGSSFELIEGAGHLIQLDAPEQLTSSLLRWLVDAAH